MSFDRADHHDSLKSRAARHASELMPVARLISGAVPVMNALVQDERWDRYLQILQGFIERWKAAEAQALRQLGDPSVWNAEALLKLKGDALMAKATIEALEMALQLPILITKGGTAADDFIAQHGVPDGTASSDRT